MLLGVIVVLSMFGLAVVVVVAAQLLVEQLNELKQATKNIEWAAESIERNLSGIASDINSVNNTVGHWREDW